MINQNSQFLAILTNIGMAKQANADALGVPWKITAMGVGDANDTDPVPSAAQKTLINERRRAPLNQLKVDPNNIATIIAEQVIPPEVGGWWIREIGLYDADGDLVAVANCAPTFKPLLTQGAGRTQVVRLNLLVSNTGNVELKIDPSVVLATRDYVDRKVIEEINKLDGKQSVRVAATANIVLSGLQPVDAVQVAAGDRVLAPFQAAAKDRGLYTVVAGGPWVRTADADSSLEVTPGLLVTVEEGATYAESIWELTTDAPIVLGTTALTFEMVAGVTVGPGTYRQVTVDKRGRVIGGYNPTTLSGFGIGDAYTAAQVDGFVGGLSTAINSKLDMAGGSISGEVTFFNDTDDSPELRWNNTLWNTYIDLYKNQFRIIADQSGPPIYPMVFDLNANTLSSFGNTVFTSGNFDPSLKANKATTLGGYGITDAYTKTAVDAIATNLSNSINNVNTTLTASITPKLDKTGGSVSGRITLTDGTNASPALRMNNTSWNAYMDVFSDQLRLYADQGAAVTYPLVFDLTAKFASLFGGTVWTSLNRPKNTVSWGANGWFRDSDTGRLDVWGQASIEVPNAVGSVANLAITFSTNFPLEISNVSFAKVAGDATEVVESDVGFYGLTNSGMTISVKRVSGAQTGGEKIIVHYRVTGR
ncbi:MAG TPA: phage tail protein [Pseudomonas sp.]|uniref:phage tail protein n=1 Tax=Pseudomonas sp. TaxID=306 RepID=UPI002ED96FE9